MTFKIHAWVAEIDMSFGRDELDPAWEPIIRLIDVDRDTLERQLKRENPRGKWVLRGKIGSRQRVFVTDLLTYRVCRRLLTLGEEVAP